VSLAKKTEILLLNQLVSRICGGFLTNPGHPSTSSMAWCARAACTGKKREHIELLELDQTGIHVAEYLTELPPRQLLEQKLHEAVALSKARLENRADDTGGELEADAP
jgi:hypothetical protein